MIIMILNLKNQLKNKQFIINQLQLQILSIQQNLNNINGFYFFFF